jgi:hypothetical protein
MPKPCKKGEIWREGYIRRVSKKGSKKRSKKGSKKYVSGKCIKATSQTGEKMTEINKRRSKEKRKTHKIAREKFGTPICKQGEIIKEGFHRTSKSGKKTWISPTCIPDIGRVGKSKQTIYIEPDRLSKYGYNDIEMRSDLARHKSLLKAIREGEKPLSVRRRLVALSTLSRNTNPNLSRRFKEDSEWLKLTDEYKLERKKN